MLEVTGGSMATVLDKVELDWPEHYAATELARKVGQRGQQLRSQVVTKRFGWGLSFFSGRLETCGDVRSVPC